MQWEIVKNFHRCLKQAENFRSRKVRKIVDIS